MSQSSTLHSRSPCCKTGAQEEHALTLIKPGLSFHGFLLLYIIRVGCSTSTSVRVVRVQALLKRGTFTAALGRRCLHGREGRETSRERERERERASEREKASQPYTLVHMDAHTQWGQMETCECNEMTTAFTIVVEQDKTRQTHVQTDRTRQSQTDPDGHADKHTDRRADTPCGEMITKIIWKKKKKHFCM